MTASYPVRSRTLSPAICPGIRMRAAKLSTPVIAQTCFCVLPAALCIGYGLLSLAGLWLFCGLLLFMAYGFLKNKPEQATALMIALIPGTMLLRGMFFYSAQIVIPVAPVIFQLVAPQHGLTGVRKDKLLLGLLVVAIVYWWLSYLIIGDYSVNSRMVELTFTAANVYLLASRRSYLASALVGLAISTFAVAGGLLPYGDRLGTLQIAEFRMGNPVAMGLSSTLVLLMIFADQGRWLLLGQGVLRRVLLVVPAALSLALSTSRGSWLVTGLGLTLILALARQGRRMLIGMLALCGVAVTLLLLSDRGPAILHYFDEATSSDVSWQKRTTGRMDQWESFPAVFFDSPIWGFGPGSGKAVSLHYTKEGKTWHSLYLLVGVETGLIGLIGLMFLLGALTRRGIAHWRTRREITPLLGLVSFMTIGVSVSGIDAISGVFLGIAFLADRYPPIVRVREVGVLQPASEQNPEEPVIAKSI